MYSAQARKTSLIVHSGFKTIKKPLAARATGTVQSVWRCSEDKSLWGGIPHASVFSPLWSTNTVPNLSGIFDAQRLWQVQEEVRRQTRL